LAGARVAARLPSSAVEAAFGLFLLAYVGLAWRKSALARWPATPGVLLGGGVASGFIAGLIGTGGAIRSACLMAFGLPKEVYIGTSAAIALIVDATRLPVYVAEGFLPRTAAPLMAALVPVAFAGAWCGQRLVRRISPEGFRRFVMAVLALMGLRMAWHGWHGG
jgi:uncharacterized membrane protein YfcA